MATEPTIDLREHPIMLTLQDSISGNGFLARITMSGRALVRKEDDGKWWMYGVRPAAIAASGANVDEAFLRFRNRYREILMDIAEESLSFEAFSSEVERFFNQGDADNEDERLWEKAFLAIRSAGCEPPAPFSHLPKRSPDQNPAFIRVERADVPAKGIRLTPSENVPDVYAYTQAKAA